MNKSLIVALIVLLIVSFAIFLQKFSNLEMERNALLLRVSTLENRISELNMQNFEATSLPQLVTANIEPDQSKMEPVSNKNTRLNMPTEDALTTEAQDLADMDDISNAFESELTDLNWAIEYEKNIEELFNQSEKLSDMGLVSSECRSTTCKIVVTRSNRGAFLDANAFSSEKIKKQWGGYSGFSFEFGKEGQEEYLTLWVKR